MTQNISKTFLRRKGRCLVAAIGLGTLLALLLASLCSFGRVCAGLREQTLRLHVRANSDSEADQAVKLAVRDALVEECAALFGDASDLDGALTAAEQALPQLQRTAQRVVRRAGYSYPVRVRLAEEYFDTRRYGDYTLPAGRYQSLLVELGQAAGHNWWCVLFPPLCVPAATPASEEAAAVWGPEGVRVATEGPAVRFALLEWLEKLRSDD